MKYLPQTKHQLIAAIAWQVVEFLLGKFKLMGAGSVLELAWNILIKLLRRRKPNVDKPRSPPGTH